MNNNQSEALRLADAVCDYTRWGCETPEAATLRRQKTHKEAAAELRRLHEVNAELVEALERLARLGNGDQYGNSIGNEIAQEALRKAQGDNNANG